MSNDLTKEKYLVVENVANSILNLHGGMYMAKVDYLVTQSKNMAAYLAAQNMFGITKTKDGYKIIDNGSCDLYHAIIDMIGDADFWEIACWLDSLEKMKDGATDDVRKKSKLKRK